MAFNMHFGIHGYRMIELFRMEKELWLFEAF